MRALNAGTDGWAFTRWGPGSQRTLKEGPSQRRTLLLRQVCLSVHRENQALASPRKGRRLDKIKQKLDPIPGEVALQMLLDFIEAVRMKASYFFKSLNNNNNKSIIRF